MLIHLKIQLKCIERLIFFCRESDLVNQGYYLIAQELVYQWLGTWITPYWWTDAHVNKAIAGFLAASTANEVSKWFISI